MLKLTQPAAALAAHAAIPSSENRHGRSPTHAVTAFHAESLPQKQAPSPVVDVSTSERTLGYTGRMDIAQLHFAATGASRRGTRYSSRRNTLRVDVQRWRAHGHGMSQDLIIIIPMTGWGEGEVVEVRWFDHEPEPS